MAQTKKTKPNLNLPEPSEAPVKQSESPQVSCTRPMSPLLRQMLVGSRQQLPPKPNLDDQAITFWRSVWWPVILILWTAPTALIIPMTTYNYGGSILKMLQTVPITQMWLEFPRPSIEAALIIIVFVVFEALLLEFLPGKTIYGPPTPAGETPMYYDNGMKAWLVTHVLWFVVGPICGWYDFGRIYDVWGEIISTFHVTALLFCGFLYWKGKHFPSSWDAVYTGRIFFDFFQGIELHPRLFDLNLKQLLNCRVSMMMWSVSYLCFAQAQYNRGALSTGMIVTVSLLILYLAKFFWWEAGYFASIDIIHDRCGYYLIWGVLVWVPSCYCAPGFLSVEHPADWHPALAVLLFAIGVFALYVNYDADRQRQLTRATAGKGKFWGRTPSVINASYVTTDGESRTTILLCDGYWGWARHFNYVPEISLAVAWTVPSGMNLLLPWIYAIFLTCLLIDRSDRDDEKCAAKYGKAWEEYCSRVPAKILPGIY